MSEHKPPKPEQPPAEGKASGSGRGGSGSKGKQSSGQLRSPPATGRERDAPTKPAPPGDGAQPPKPAVSRSPAAGRAGLAVAVLALLVGIGTAVAGYFIWHEVTRLDRAQQAGVNRLQSAVDSMRSSVADEQRHQRQQLDALRAREDSMEAGVAGLRAQVSRTSEGWVLANVQYLLQVANESLQLQRDVGTAQAALKDADQRLEALGDPGYLPVRKEIAGEITALAAVPVPDIAGITVTLDSLIHQVPQLALQGTAVVNPPAPGGSPGSATAAAGTRWRELPGEIWRALRQLVQVRHHEKPVGPLLAPKDEYFLYQNMKLQLEAAQLAALRQQSQSYRTSLRTALQWLDEYFAADNALTQSMVQQLQQLQSVDVHPQLPDLSGSLRKLRELRASLEREGQAGPPAASGADGQPAKPMTPPPAAGGGAAPSQPPATGAGDNGGGRNQPPATGAQ